MVARVGEGQNLPRIGPSLSWNVNSNNYHHHHHHQHQQQQQQQQHINSTNNINGIKTASTQHHQQWNHHHHQRNLHPSTISMVVNERMIIIQCPAQFVVVDQTQQVQCP